MARYLQKYVGTYRVVAEYNKDTNDFPRTKDGAIDPSFDDLYIPCAGGVRIYHVGGNKLQCYIPSLGKGHNILKSIYNDMYENVDSLDNNYEEIHKGIIDNGIIFDIEETSGEILFKFKASHIDKILKYIKPKTNGASISPFSKKNLPKQKYHINDKDLALYREITSVINDGNIKLYQKLNTGFLNTLTSKKYSLYDIKSDMKLCGLKGKNYIHSKGLWDSYIIYLREELKDYGN